MRRRLLLGLVAMASACAVAAATAGGASTPPALLLVFHPATLGKTTEALVAVLPTEGNTLSAGSVSVYLPSGYTLNLSLPPGTPVGSAIVISQFNPADLTVTDPATVTTDPCAPGTHAAVWTANATVSGQPLVIHVFVDPTTGDDVAKGAYRLTFCQTEPLLFVLEGVVNTPTAPGIYTWRAIVTPPGVNGAPPDPATAYELRAVVPLPHFLKAKATYSTRTHSLVISGKVTAGTAPEAGAKVIVERRKGDNLVPFASGTTKADGSFTITKRVVQKKTAQTIGLDVSAEKPTGACTDPPLAPAGCLIQTYSPSDDVAFAVHIPKLPPKPKPKKH